MYLEQELERILSSSREYCKIRGIMQLNAQGSIYLIGGSVYRNLAHIMYGIQRQKVDFDFLVENPYDSLLLPKGWIEEKNRYGNPKLIYENISVDFVPLSNVREIKLRNLDPTIENYLAITPLTIQSIAYNITTQKLLGNVGLDALRKKTVGVHFEETIDYFEHSKGKPINEIIEEKATSLGFTPLYQSHEKKGG